VVATLHQTPVTTLLLTVPPYIFGVITLLCNSFHADKTGERFYHVVIPLCFGAVAYIIAATTTSFAARYVAIMMMPAGTLSGYAVCLAWISNTLPRPPAKRAAALAMINSVSNMTSIYSSFMYQDYAAPRFVAAMTVNAITLFVAGLCAFALRIILTKLNKGLAINQGDYEISVGNGENRSTKRGFRYLV
jgi:hypothetical protein